MVCAISVQDSKHLVHCKSFSNIVQSGPHQFQLSRKHELDNDNSCISDMRALIISSEQFSPTSLTLAASNNCRPQSFKRSISGKNSLWDFVPLPLPFKQLQTCLLLLFVFLLCFSFILAICSTLDASMRIHTGKRSTQERRLMGFHIDNTEGFNYFDQRIEHVGHAPPSHSVQAAPITYNKEAALHGLGVVFSKGTKSMQNLIIANLEESCDMLDFRLFLRTLYRSGAMAKSDLVLLFPWPSLPQDVSQVLQEEDNSFKKLLKSSTPSGNTSAFDANAFEGRSNLKDDAKSTDKRRLFIMWGENSNSSNYEESHLNQFEYGSVVGFHMNELDSTDGFSEFLINPSSQLRRWLCYQMLLGLLRFRFKLVMLVDLGGVLILDDVFSQGKKKDFLYLSLEDSTWADTTAEYNQPAHQGEERRSLSPKGVQDDDEMVLSNTDDDTIQSVPVGHGAGQITPMKSRIGAVSDRRIQMHVYNSKGLVVKRRKQQMMDKSAHYRTRDGELGKADTHAEKRIVRRNRQDAMGKAMSNMVKPNAEVREQEPRHAGAKRMMMEMVYGKEVWECLEQAEKQRKVVSSRVILGSMRSAKGLANSMAVEIVRVALQRNSKLSFPDRALLSYLVQKSSHLLGKRVADSLQLMRNGESMVHCVDNSEQRNLFVRPHDGQNYTVVQASSLNMRPKSMQTHQKHQSLMSNLTLSHLIRADICASTADSVAFYHDCGLIQ